MATPPRSSRAAPPTRTWRRCRRTRWRDGVRHAWLVDPLARTLEVFALGADGRWILAGVHRGDAAIRAEPFEALELELALLWAE